VNTLQRESGTAIVCQPGRVAERGISVSRDQASRPERRPRLQYHSGRPDLIINHYLLAGVDAVSVAVAALEWPSVSVKG